MIGHSIRELEAFVAVAEELSFTRAAARLRLAQPPLSRHVQFLSEVREPLRRLERASSAAQRAAAGETGRLELGFVSSLLGPELADLFCDFRASSRRRRAPRPSSPWSPPARAWRSCPPRSAA
jgi:DNA-binding transcriptional LysR family regulator